LFFPLWKSDFCGIIELRWLFLPFFILTPFSALHRAEMVTDFSDPCGSRRGQALPRLPRFPFWRDPARGRVRSRRVPPKKKTGAAAKPKDLRSQKGSGSEREKRECNL
jgi:hypothetical protein